MNPKHRVIIDTDPGVDDTLALLLALSADPELLQLELISVTYGNVEVERYCLESMNAKNALLNSITAAYEMWSPSSTTSRRKWRGGRAWADQKDSIC